MEKRQDETDEENMDPNIPIGLECLCAFHDSIHVYENVGDAILAFQDAFGYAFCEHCGDEIMGDDKHVHIDQCSACKTVSYCSKECQAADWTEGGHKAECAAITGEHTWDQYADELYSAPVESSVTMRHYRRFAAAAIAATYEDEEPAHIDGKFSGLGKMFKGAKSKSSSSKGLGGAAKKKPGMLGKVKKVFGRLRKKRRQKSQKSRDNGEDGDDNGEDDIERVRANCSAWSDGLVSATLSADDDTIQGEMSMMIGASLLQSLGPWGRVMKTALEKATKESEGLRAETAAAVSRWMAIPMYEREKDAIERAKKDSVSNLAGESGTFAGLLRAAYEKGSRSAYQSMLEVAKASVKKASRSLISAHAFAREADAKSASPRDSTGRTAEAYILQGAQRAKTLADARLGWLQFSKDSLIGQEEEEEEEQQAIEWPFSGWRQQSQQPQQYQPPSSMAVAAGRIEAQNALMFRISMLENALRQQGVTNRPALEQQLESARRQLSLLGSIRGEMPPPIQAQFSSAVACMHDDDDNNNTMRRTANLAATLCSF